MPTKVVYRGYVYSLQARPGYTRNVEATSRTGSIFTQPPSQQDPPDKDMPTPITGQWNHVAPTTDVSALGGWKFNTLDRTDFTQALLTAQKLLEGNVRTVNPDQTNINLQPSVSDDRKLVSEKVEDLAQKTQSVNAGRWDRAMSMEQGENVIGQNENAFAAVRSGAASESRAEADIASMAGRADRATREMNRAVAYQAQGPLGLAGTKGRSATMEITRSLEAGTVTRVLEKDVVDFIYPTLQTGIVSSHKGSASYQNYVDRDSLNRVGPIVPLVATDEKKVLGTVMVDESVGGFRPSEPTVAKIGLHQGTMVMTPPLIPDRDPNVIRWSTYLPRHIVGKHWKHFPPRSRPIVTYGGTTPITSTHGQQVQFQEAMVESMSRSSLEQSTYHSFRAGRVPSNLVPEELIHRVTAERSAGETFDYQNRRMRPVPVETQRGLQNLEDFLLRAEITLDQQKMGWDLRVQPEKYLPQNVVATVRSDNPFDHRSHYQLTTVAQSVHDQARDYRRLEHVVHHVDNINKAVFNQKTKKIMEHDFYHRLDPRIQEIIYMKERIDTFGMYRAVETQPPTIPGRESFPYFHEQARAAQYTTKGRLIDAIAWGWGGQGHESQT